ncbi:MAG: IS110 family transposase [Candidatus Promineofilum sp.]|uniref:IS110 family transposase n=1 Tax=Promineifilum sp. TaxID=2664178 RepID=UPI002411BCBC|nr:IS110 family transposase [Promineifilum sp.]
MEVLFARCSGLDVHKQSVVACIRIQQDDGRVEVSRKRFGTTTNELRSLSEWLVSLNVTQVAMESTGVYWKPVYNILHPVLDVWVVNARHLQQVPGRKTDESDAEWIAKLMSHGLLERSFIPEESQRDLRDLTRYRTRLKQEKSNAANRLHKILEDANIKLTSVATSIQGVSARLMLEALIADEQSPEEMAQLAQKRMRSKIPQLVEALTGQVREHHRFMLQELLYQLDSLNQRIETLDRRIAELTQPYADLIRRIDAIPGVGPRTAEVILAEVGFSVEAWPSSKKLAAWACVCPGNHESAGKRKSGKRRKGQKWLVSALVEAAWAASRTKETYLASQFHRLRARRGPKRAAMAVAHSILTIVYHLLADPNAEFDELGGDFLLKRNKEQEQRRAVKTLQTIGYNVTLTPIAA